MSAPRPIALLAGGTAGIAIGLAASPTEWCALAFLAPALLLLAIEDGGRSEDARASRSNALWAGAVCGFAVNALTMRWAVGLLEVYAFMPAIGAWPLAALLWLGQSLPWIFATWMASICIAQRLPGWVVLPACIAIAGSAAPMLFPWRLGISQMPALYFVQLADVGGLPLLDFALALGSCAALEAARSRRARVAAIALFALGAPYAYGHWRVDHIRALRERAPSLRVGVVQPSFGIFERVPMMREADLRLLRTMSRELEARGAELVLWPESAYPSSFDRAAFGGARRLRRDVLREGVRGPLLFGTQSHAGGSRFNSVLAIAADGEVAGVYDKVHLLAFGEYVPLWDYLPPIQPYFPRGLTSGARAASLTVAGARIGPLNCYEDLLPGHARATAALDPDFLANFTNDAWFGDTDAPHLHHMLARLRAVETRRDLVRATNTGVSALVTATGQDAARTLAFERDSFVADVRLLRGVRTGWVRFGDWVTPSLLGALLGALLARRRSRTA